MWTKLFGVAAVAGAIALVGITPVLAVCNPGTPNCIRADSPWLARAEQQVNQGNGNFNCGPGPAGICSDDLPGSARTTTQHVPLGGGTMAPRIRR
jgi:hypothetical protein